jgi:hypothetical protein
MTHVQLANNTVLVLNQLTTSMKTAWHDCVWSLSCFMSDASGMKICVQTGNQNLRNLIWRLPLHQWRICWSWMKNWWYMYVTFNQLYVLFPFFLGRHLFSFMSVIDVPSLEGNIIMYYTFIMMKGHKHHDCMLHLKFSYWTLNHW